LNYGSGKGFIELVEKLCHENLEKIPDNYKTVPNAVFEKINSVNGPNPHPGCLILKRMLEGRRIYFMTMFCWHVLLAFVRLTCHFLANFHSLKAWLRSTVNRLNSDTTKNRAGIRTIGSVFKNISHLRWISKVSLNKARPIADAASDTAPLAGSRRE
jgi:hypothetical protein